jgi:hypothetical protein
MYRWALEIQVGRSISKLISGLLNLSSSLHQISPVGWPSGGDESRAEVHRVRRCGGTFQTAARRQVLAVRGAADGENCAGVRAVGAGGNRGTPYNGKCGGVRQSGQGEIGTYTTLAPRDEPKRWQLGPTILFDRPRPAPPIPPPSDFPRGVAQRLSSRQIDFVIHEIQFLDHLIVTLIS